LLFVDVVAADGRKETHRFSAHAAPTAEESQRETSQKRPMLPTKGSSWMRMRWRSDAPF